MIDLLMNDTKGFLPLGKGRELELALAVATGKASQREDAMWELVRHNIRFIVSVANGYTRCGIPLEDLVSEGILGMRRAAEDYDGKVKFCTYASAWVRKYMMEAIANMARPVKVPQREMAKYGGAPPASGTDAIMYMEADSIDKKITEYEENTEKSVAVGKLLAYLTARERSVVCFTFGIGGHPAMTSEDIAGKLKISGQAVRATRARAMRKMSGGR